MALWDNVEKLDKSKYPSFQRLWTAYPSTLDDPCNRNNVEYKCAVYSSTAFVNAGIIGSKGYLITTMPKRPYTVH